MLSAFCSLVKFREGLSQIHWCASGQTFYKSNLLQFKVYRQECTFGGKKVLRQRRNQSLLLLDINRKGIVWPTNHCSSVSPSQRGALYGRADRIIRYMNVLSAFPLIDRRALLVQGEQS